MDSPCRVSALQDAAEPGREDAHRRRQAQQPGGRPQAAREARLRIDAAAAAIFMPSFACSAFSLFFSCWVYVCIESVHACQILLA